VIGNTGRGKTSLMLRWLEAAKAAGREVVVFDTKPRPLPPAIDDTDRKRTLGIPSAFFTDDHIMVFKLPERDAELIAKLRRAEEPRR
jgi:hypothetical protein